MKEFKAQKLLGYIHSGKDGVHTSEPSLCFHTVPINKNLFQNFVSCMWAVPNPSSVILSHHRCSFRPDMEQVVVLTLCGNDLTQGLSLLNRVQIEEGDEQHARFRLLSLKWLPVLTRLQAQELSPYEVGDPLCYTSMETLMSSSALVCALRGFADFSSLRKLLPHDCPQSLSVLMSPTPEVALRQASLFFFEHEMIPDPQMLLTVCLLKPRAWNHSLTKIVSKLQQSGLTLVGIRVVTHDKSGATSLLRAESGHNLCSGPSLALCLQGENAVKRLLDMLSQEDSSMWMTCHGSGSYQQAIMDVRRFFPEGLCCTETNTMRQEQILSLCSDPLASVERQRSCTLTQAARESLSVSSESRPNGGSLKHRQTTCLLIPLNATPGSQVPSQLEIVEQVLGSDCHLVAGRMSILDDEQQKHISETLKASSIREKINSTPCLIMALRRENIATEFGLILKRIYKERPDLEQVGKSIVFPENEKEAMLLICYLFDTLSSESCDVTVP
ncbi:dynein axonemal assembly factor 8 isoform X2 [Pelmatolapia mariae]|uniref:dynein axonemal assembly factor 8 isoform X2 n=1 Tax=Pelmatolapia mariae TaxID=158779 RepID=UPI002FE5B89C